MPVHLLNKPQAAPRTPAGYRMVARGGKGEIYIYGTIGGGFWLDEGVTAKQFADDLKALGKVSEIDVRLQSEGGDVFEGRTIYTLLAQHEARITVHVDGVAASIASLIAMAGEEIRMGEGSFMMIHDAWGLVIGNAEEMRRMADLLETVSGSIAETYAARSGQKLDAVKQMMHDETWMTAEEAKDKGFADVVEEPVRAAAALSLPATIQARCGIKNPPNIYRHPPAVLSARHVATLSKISAMHTR